MDKSDNSPVAGAKPSGHDYQTGIVQLDKTSSSPNLVFQCQQAHGGSIGAIFRFSNMPELYQKIADCFDLTIDDILFCTRNTRRVDMENIVATELCCDDFIFVHRKGLKKELEVTKSENTLGLTLTDNGNGCTIIKGIKEGSVIDQNKEIKVIGDHIESIDDTTMVGLGYKEVANYLKALSVGTKFTMHVVEPRKIADGALKTAIKLINRVLKDQMGMEVPDLGSQLFELALSKLNIAEFARAVDNSDLEPFGFTDDILIEIWGIVSDAKAGRLVVDDEKK